jgi:hypothetical protein
VRTASPKQPRSFFFYCGIIGIVWTIVIVLGGSDTVAVSNAILHAGLGPLIFGGLAMAWAFCALDVYGHLWPDHDDRTRSMVDEVFAGVEAAYTTKSS